MNTPLVGYRTFIVAALGLVFAALTYYGIIVPESDRAAIEVAVFAVITIGMRFASRTPAGRQPPIIVTETGSRELGGKQ